MDEKLIVNIEKEDKENLKILAKSKGLRTAPYVRFLILKELKKEGENGSSE